MTDEIKQLLEGASFDRATPEQIQLMLQQSIGEYAMQNQGAISGQEEINDIFRRNAAKTYYTATIANGGDEVHDALADQLMAMLAAAGIDNDPDTHLMLDRISPVTTEHAQMSLDQIREYFVQGGQQPNDPVITALENRMKQIEPMAEKAAEKPDDVLLIMSSDIWEKVGVDPSLRLPPESRQIK